MGGALQPRARPGNGPDDLAYPGGVYWLDFRAGAGEVRKFEDAVAAMLRGLYGPGAPTVGDSGAAKEKLLELVDKKQALVADVESRLEQLLAEAAAFKA